MMTFEEFAKSGYTAYEILPISREQLIHRFEPKYPEVICKHITVKFPAKSTDELPPLARQAHVIGYAEEPGLEALVVEINGSTKRPDGGTYHITLSLSREAKKKPVHSNALIRKGFIQVTPSIPIHLTPSFIT